ncbi:GNAT family N-acetyltransferase [Vibrio intestinalis]|uniref:GNAT family N-acetyltransferase n=1 Tax=Vibrio intestinalis TaxID=2933291 RepID=UPI0021A7E217|nr:N-acetyltransferase [Vibrio intestinalis]
MQIRQEKQSDVSTIEAVTYAAFENHPHHEPGAKPTEHLMINKLRDSNALTLSLVAEDETGIVGHIAFSAVEVNGETCHWYGLGPVSVLPERQGEGIGGALIRQGIEHIQLIGGKGVVLLGEPEYYQRFGFKPHPQLTLQGVPAEYFLSYSLVDEPLPTGAVVYHSAFS